MIRKKFPTQWKRFQISTVITLIVNWVQRSKSELTAKFTIEFFFSKTHSLLLVFKEYIDTSHNHRGFFFHSTFHPGVAGFCGSIGSKVNEKKREKQKIQNPTEKLMIAARLLDVGLHTRPREAPAKFFSVFMNQYYCKNYILMIFYHSLSTQNRILNSANHGVKNEEMSKEASFFHFLDLFRPFCFLHVFMVWHYMESIPL